MAIRAPVANHGAILLPGEKILHHLAGQVSCIESYNPPAVPRHHRRRAPAPEVDGSKLVSETEIDAWDLVPQRIRDHLEDARQGRLDV